MKKTLFLFAMIFSMFSCQDGYDTVEKSTTDFNIETRKSKKCIQKFTPGNVYGGIFGATSWASFGDDGWKGSFESEFFPCPGYQYPGTCCSEVIIDDFRIETPPFSTTCNYDLNALELQNLADVIWAQATENPPICKGVELTPIDINVTVGGTSCCVINPPCPNAENPCDCYDQYPDHPYWGCCESYSFFIEVKYARTTLCYSELTPG